MALVFDAEQCLSQMPWTQLAFVAAPMQFPGFIPRTLQLTRFGCFSERSLPSYANDCQFIF